MCTVFLALDQHPEYKLVLLANRDEFYERPTAHAQLWEDDSGIVGGRDLKDGGTWMGVTEKGRYAVITNYREIGKDVKDAPSRGHLVKDFLAGTHGSSLEFYHFLQSEGRGFNGFNLIFGDTEGLHYYSNRGAEQTFLPSGNYGLSNHLLDTPWPKVEHGKQELASLLNTTPQIEPNVLLPVLQHSDPWPDDQLPDTGIGLEWERILSSVFIKSENYGTRASTVVLVDHNDHLTFHETVHDDGRARTYGFDIV